MQLAEISDKIYHFVKLLQKQNFDANMYTHHTVVLPAATISAAHHLSLYGYQYS
jgi:hypothetical protein